VSKKKARITKNRTGKSSAQFGEKGDGAKKEKQQGRFEIRGKHWIADRGLTLGFVRAIRTGTKLRRKGAPSRLPILWRRRTDRGGLLWKVKTGKDSAGGIISGGEEEGAGGERVSSRRTKFQVETESKHPRSVVPRPGLVSDGHAWGKGSKIRGSWFSVCLGAWKRVVSVYFSFGDGGI